MLYQAEIDLIKAMRAVLTELTRDSFNYVLIFGEWLLYTNGYSILWIYDPVRFKGINGAAHLSYLSEPDRDPIIAEQFFNNDAYKDLTDPDRLKLLQFRMPLLATEDKATSSLEAYAIACDLVTNGPGNNWLDSNWVFSILDLFCPIGENCSVHPGPAPRYLEKEAGVWFKKGNSFLGVLPVCKADSKKLKQP